MKLKKYLSAIIGSLLLTLGVVTFTGSIGSKVVNAEESTIKFANGVYSGSGTSGIITWEDDSGHLSIKQEKGNAKSSVSSSYISAPRWYASHVITFSVDKGYNVSNLSITATDTDYASALGNSTWSRGEVSVTGSVVTSTAEVTSSEPLIITMGAQSRISSIKFTLNELSPAEPEDPEFTNAKASLDIVKAHMRLGYKYDSSIKTQSVFEKITNNNSITDGDEVVIVSKFDGKYYALSNDISKAATAVNISVNENQITSSISEDIVWKIEIGSAEKTYALLNNENYLSAVASKTDITLSPSKVDFIFTYKSDTQMYFGVGTRALFVNDVPVFRNYATSNFGQPNYATETYIFKKSAQVKEVEIYENVEGRIKFGVDSGINAIDKALSGKSYEYGIEVSTETKTVKYKLYGNIVSTSKEFAQYIDDTYKIRYVVVNIGDFINDIDRASTIFTVKAYLTYDSKTVYPDEQTTPVKSNSVYTMLKTYKTDENLSVAQKESVNELYDLLTSLGAK